MDSVPDAGEIKERPVVEEACKALNEIVEEKQAMYAKETNDTVGAESDLEAQVKPNQGIGQVPAASRLPKTYEGRRAMRVPGFDNLRTVVIYLLVLQNAVIFALSSHPNAFQLEKTAPKTFAAATILIGIGRMALVPLLFFLSGFSNKLALMLHLKSYAHFFARKISRAVLSVLALQGMVMLSKHIYSEVPTTEGTQVPYYATQEGRLSLLNGPTYYILAVFTLDCIHFVFHILNFVIFGAARHRRFITTLLRYHIARIGMLAGLEFWIIFCARGIGLNRLPAHVQKWIYATNSAELHSPFSYIAAYLAGIYFITYHKFILYRFKAICATALTVRLSVSIFLLTTLYFYSPHIIPPHFNLLARPSLTLVGIEGSNWTYYLYIMWAVVLLIDLPEPLIAFFFFNPSLRAPWGRSSRYAYIQIYVQLIMVSAPLGTVAPHFVENFLLRGLFNAVVSFSVGSAVALCMDTIYIRVIRLWKVLSDRGVRLEPDVNAAPISA
ncbi:hypothetical protein HYPSUDRAFT_45562 [Hypholoma sublateritium FD-334 SS-4]|uniref:Uncharacterized protein n=1 Tax=Hypholoma sublateritium (strain FD-334 SS-4) TaxID=945553 RepID=A0A0D2KUE2_HYPSF|nr:hypothetical protein HYPSUDRAFT_45562 [Hypholoma sublateritium FD-334 SS-4]